MTDTPVDPPSRAPTDRRHRRPRRRRPHRRRRTRRRLGEPERRTGARRRVRAARRPPRRLHHRRDHHHVVVRLSSHRRGVFVVGATVDGNQVTTSRPGGVIGSSWSSLASSSPALLPVLLGSGGQTPGMRPFGLRVVRDRTAAGSAGARRPPPVGLWVAGAVFYLGFIWIFIDKRRRGWQDLIAGTVVVKRP